LPALETRFDKTQLLAQFDRIHESMKAADGRPIPKFEKIEKPSRPIHPWIYLPVEIKARELESKALVAREAAEAGFRVVIGAIWLMHPMAAHFPPGVVLFKSVNGMDVGNIALWAGHGHMTAVLDEEIFGIKATPAYIAATTHPHIAVVTDLVCAQGSAYAEAFPYSAEVKVTGNPRTLMYQTSMGDDILVCLQSGNINNNGRTFDEMVRQVLSAAMPLKSAGGQAWVDILRSSIAHECDTLPLVRSSIDALAASFPTHRIVVRPHPVEDPSIWVFDKPNIVLDDRRSVIESLQHAGCLVYVSGCTTGLDAYLAGVPAVRLGRGGVGISAEMHAEALTPEAAVEAVQNAKPWEGRIEDHFGPVTLAKELMQMQRDNPADGTPSITARVKAEPQEFHRRKFPDTSPEEIEALLGRKVSQIAWNTFLV